MRACATSYTEKRGRRLLLLSGALCAASALLSVCIGSTDVPLSQLWQALIGSGQAEAVSNILWYMRLPRTLACLAAGAALAVSGGIIQMVLANPLASPNIIGVNAGAGLAVALCCAFLPTMGLGLSGAAFAGAALAVALVVGIAGRTGASRTSVILSGVAVNACLNACSDAVVTLFPDSGLGSADFRVGGFSAILLDRLWPAAILIGAAVLISFTLSNELEVLSLGEETAHGLGLPVKGVRTLLLGLAALLAGAAVSFAGQLGFVGLIVPHMVRYLGGREGGYFLPASALLGATLVTLCDIAARRLFSPYEIPVGILLSLIGGPFFLLLLFRRRGGHRGD